MPMENRAAQFAPFAALVGYDDAISEATRLTDARTMLSSDEMEELSQCLNQALENITERDSYTFIYFIPDNKKSGGKYETVTGIIKSFNEYERTIKRHYKIFCVNVKYGIQYGFRIFYLIALQNEENYEREESCSA